MMAEAPAAILHHEANLKAVLQENTRSPRPWIPRNCQSRLPISGLLLHKRKIHFHFLKLLSLHNLIPVDTHQGCIMTQGSSVPVPSWAPSSIKKIQNYIVWLCRYKDIILSRFIIMISLLALYSCFPYDFKIFNWKCFVVPTRITGPVPSAPNGGIHPSWNSCFIMPYPSRTRWWRYCKSSCFLDQETEARKLNLPRFDSRFIQLQP